MYELSQTARDDVDAKILTLTAKSAAFNAAINKTLVESQVLSPLR